MISDDMRRRRLETVKEHMDTEVTKEFDRTLATFDGRPHYEIMATGQTFDGDDEVMGYYRTASTTARTGTASRARTRWCDRRDRSGRAVANAHLHRAVHLDRLCGEGLAERIRLTRAGVGRPRTGYRSAQALDYSVLAGVLAVGLGHSPQARAHRAARAGRVWVRRMPDSATAMSGGDIQPEEYLEHRTDAALGLFSRLGFAPALADTQGQDPSSERTIRLTACPVRNLARAHPESVCGVHLGLLQGLVDDPRRAARRPSVEARLEPFAEPEACIARLVRQG